MKTYRFILAIALGVSVSGCSLFLPKPTDHAAKVSTFEAVEPNAGQLAAGDTSEASTVLRNLDNARGDLRGKPGIDVAALTRRLDAAEIRYRIAAAKLLPSATQSLLMLTGLRHASEEPNPELNAEVARYGEEILADHRAEHDEKHTYHDPKSTDAYRRAKGFNDLRRVGTGDPTIGNCLVARAPFGADPAPNPGLTVVTQGDEIVYVRCYVEIDYKPAGQLYVELLGPTPMTVALDKTHIRDHHIDFKLPSNYVDAGFEAAPSYLPMELAFAYTVGLSKDIVVDPDGRLRLAPEVEKTLLAAGAFVHIPEVSNGAQASAGDVTNPKPTRRGTSTRSASAR